MVNTSAKVAVVTGGTQGIGRKTTEHLLDRDFNVAVCARSLSDINEMVEVVSRNWGDDHFLGEIADVTSILEMDDFANKVATKFGKVNVLINNAAIFGSADPRQVLETQEWKHVLDVNVTGTVNSIRAFAALLTVNDRTGRIVNLSGGGVGGSTPLSEALAYATSKYAICGLTEMLESYTRELGCTINAIAPGAIATNFMSSVIKSGREWINPALFDSVANQDPNEIETQLDGFFNLLDFLLEDQSQLISGRVLSARWNKPEQLLRLFGESSPGDLYQLRRIDEEIFGEVNGSK